MSVSDSTRHSIFGFVLRFESFESAVRLDGELGVFFFKGLTFFFCRSDSFESADEWQSAVSDSTRQSAYPSQVLRI